MTKNELLQFLANKIIKIKKDSPILIGVNGVSASGKTTFTKELVNFLKNIKRHIIFASIDNFHNPQKIRYRKGRNSPIGYYQDSFNYSAIIENLLQPLSSANLQYKTAYFDHLIDSEVRRPKENAQKDSILIMEGVFLFRSELIQYWDLKIFLDVNFEISLERALNRKKDQQYLGSTKEIIDKYHKRYIPGEKLYLQEVRPKEKADIVINNNDFNNPQILKN